MIKIKEGSARDSPVVKKLLFAVFGIVGHVPSGVHGDDSEGGGAGLDEFFESIDCKELHCHILLIVFCVRFVSNVEIAKFRFW